MKILAVTPYYSPEGGGLERYAHEILSRLAAKGHDVQALTFTKQTPCIQVLDGVGLERVKPLVRLGNAPVHPSFPLRVARRIRQHEPDVLLAHTPVPFPAEAAYLASLAHEVPFVLTFHAGRLQASSPPLEALATLDRWTMQRSMLHGADQLIAVSPHVQANALARHEEHTTIVPPGVDHERFTPHSDGEGQREEEGEGEEEGDREPGGILFVGPLDTSYRWKGLDVLLEALARVRRQYPQARLELVGEGDRYEQLLTEAVDRPIRLHGHLTDEALAEAYRRASVTVLPSTSEAESFGMVLAEANACGCPVVGSEIGGIPSFVDHGHNGLLARPGDATDLAAKILTVLENPTQAHRMGRRGRRRVQQEHDWEELTEATEALLARAVGHPSEQPRAPIEPPPAEASPGRAQPIASQPTRRGSGGDG